MTFMRSSDTPVRQFELLSQFVASRIMTMSHNLLVYFIIRWLCRRVELYVTTYISTLPVPSVNISLNYCKMGTASRINLLNVCFKRLAEMSFYTSKV